MTIPTEHSDPSVGANDPNGFTAALAAEELPAGHVRNVVHEGAEVAVYNVDGCFYATQDQCTHGLASLSDGFLIGEFIECPLHQGMFDVRTGEASSPPCVTSLKTYKTLVKDGVIFLARSVNKSAQPA